MRAIYQAPTLEAAETALADFEERWDARFPMISRSWRTHWANLTPFFDYPPQIRRVIEVHHERDRVDERPAPEGD